MMIKILPGIRGRFVLGLLGVVFLTAACVYTLSNRESIYNEHEEYFVEGEECINCHEDEAFPNISHKGDWLGGHKDYAGRSFDLCMKCHGASTCAECHGKTRELKPSLVSPEGVEKRFVHRGDYITRHKIEAKVDQTRCSSCHNLSSCRECHENRVTTRPHPPHVTTASKTPTSIVINMVQCASCHTASWCIRCHKEGGIGVNIHPGGVPLDSLLKKDKDKVCKKCHQ